MNNPTPEPVANAPAKLQLVQAPPSDDLDAWLAALRGPQVGSPKDQTTEVHETDMLRNAVLRASLQASEPTVDDNHAWQRLQFRLRQEGLARKQPASKTWLMAAAVAGLGICLAGTVAWQMTAVPGVEFVQNEPPEWREADANSAEINDDPRQQAHSIADALTAKGTAAKVYEFRGKYVVEFKVEGEKLYEIRRTTGLMGLRAQIALGKNRIVFTRKPSSSPRP